MVEDIIWKPNETFIKTHLKGHIIRWNSEDLIMSSNKEHSITFWQLFSLQHKYHNISY